MALDTVLGARCHGEEAEGKDDDRVERVLRGKKGKAGRRLVPVVGQILPLDGAAIFVDPDVGYLDKDGVLEAREEDRMSGSM